MGSGFKDWATGDVLTAADLDGYLMRQTVMTFADSAARDTALSAVLDEGMFAYLEDVDAVTYYNGSAWKWYSTLWTSFVVSISNVTIGNGSQTGRYKYVLGDLRLRFNLTMGSTSSVTGTVQMTLPNSETSHTHLASLGLMTHIDSSAGSLRISSSSRPYVAAGSTVVEFASSSVNAGFTSNTPITWATGDSLDMDITVAL